MKRGVLILLLVAAYVHPSSLQNDVPLYTDSAVAIQDAINEVDDQILSMAGNIPNVTDPRRHYAVPLAHMFIVAQQLVWSSNLDYEGVYMEYLPHSITAGLTCVKYVINKAQATIDIINNNTREIQELMEALCTETTSNEVCNQVVHQTVEGDPDRYKLEANIFLSAGKVAAELILADFESVAEDYDEIDFLIFNIDNLKDLVMSIAELIKLTERRPNCA